MKKFISKNWKNIFLIIGGIFLIIDLFFIVTTPATVQEDFMKYGPEVESDIFDSANDVSNEINDLKSSGEIVNEVSEQTGVSPAISRGLIVLAVGLIIIFIIAALTEKEDSKKK